MTTEVKAVEDKQRLRRAVVRREPEAIFEAAEDCMVYCWIPLTKLDGEDNPSAAVSDFWDPHDIWSGIELPTGGTMVPIFLNAGQALYGISKGETHLMMSVVPSKFLWLFTRGK